MGLYTDFGEMHVTAKVVLGVVVHSCWSRMTLLPHASIALGHLHYTVSQTSWLLPLTLILLVTTYHNNLILTALIRLSAILLSDLEISITGIRTGVSVHEMSQECKYKNES